MNKIKTTHVGSLPRSNELSDLLFKKDQKEKIDLNQFDEIVQRDVDNIVKKQIEVGIDYISDGEMSKISYATYVKDRIDGFSGESERKAPKDLDDFPSFKERIARTGGTPTYTRPCCTSELKIITTVMLPLAIPGLLTVMVFAMYISWNDYILAFLFVNSPENLMLNIALMKVALGGSQFEMKWGSLTSGSIISFIPIIIFYTFLQQYFVRGVTGSAVKE